MKKLIYISIIVLLFISGAILLLNPKETPLEKVTIQTGLYPVKKIEMNHTIYKNTTRTIWLQEKNAKSFSFYSDPDSISSLVEKLVSTNQNYPYLNDKDGQPVKFGWIVEKNGNLTTLKLIFPSEEDHIIPNPCG